MPSATCKKVCVAAIAFLVLAACGGQAPASVIYTFNQSNFIGDGGNYGTVEVKAGVADGLAAGTVEFHLLTNPLRVGDKFGSFAFNTDLSLAVSQITASIASWNPAAGGTNNDGFGEMDWRVRDTSAAGRSADVTITVSGLGAGEDTIAHFFFLSDGGGEGKAYYTAELFPPTGGTGFVGVGAAVPEPGSILLLSGLAGGVISFSGVRRIRNRRLAAV